MERVQKRAATDRTLFDEGGLSPQAWRESQAELSEARARVAFLEREVPLRVSSLDLRIKELEARREASEVRAPFDGTVYKTAAKLGETVRIGDPVLWFADLERLRIRANVDQVDLGRVQVGQPVVITSNAYQERDWSARVTELIPHVTMKDSRFIAEGLASVEPPSAGLVPGMTVDVEILVDSDANALQVPSEAIFTDDGGSFVYRIDGDEVRATRVRIGRSTVETIEIVDGLEPHDRVVIGPVTGLSDGARVEARIRDVGSR